MAKLIAAFLAQIAWTCSWTRTPAGRVTPERTVDHDAGRPRGARTRAPSRARPATAPAACGTRPPVTSESSRSPGRQACGTRTRRALGDVHRLDAPDRRLLHRGHGGQAAVRLALVRPRAPPPPPGMQPRQRPEASKPLRRPRDEDSRAAGRDTRADGPAERPEEGDLEAAASVGVEAADHLAAAGAGELPVGRRAAARHLDPGADDRDADEQPVALPRRRRRSRTRSPATAIAAARTGRRRRITAASRRGSADMRRPPPAAGRRRRRRTRR